MTQKQSSGLNESRRKKCASGPGFSCGIDYDFKSQYLLMSKLEPLRFLIGRGLVYVSDVRVLTSPSGRGWHVRFQADGWAGTQRELELVCGDDPWRHSYSWARGEAEDETPLFEKKKKGGVWYHEKPNEQMTRRVVEMLTKCPTNIPCADCLQLGKCHYEKQIGICPICGGEELPGTPCVPKKKMDGWSKIYGREVKK